VRGPVGWLADLRTALAFLTRIPVGGTGSLTATRLSRAALWFPAVGLVVGGVMGGVRLLAGLALPAEPATVLALAAAVVVTGGMHEDGLSDTADALGAHVTRERRLEILRDPRLGTYGALAVAFMVLFPFAVLASLPAGDVARAALVGHVLGRWSTLPQALLVPPARSGGAGALVRPGGLVTAVASLYSWAIVVAVVGPGAGVPTLAIAAVVTALGGLAVRRALGGVTGDTLGAVTKLVELAAYATLAAAW
jgi:adenosylcobinamide-GDP ribazoletransferase